MEGEIMNLMKVWLSVVVSLCYCYWIRKLIPAGTIRLLLFLPIVLLFIVLPLSLSFVHFCGITGFFISWLGNFKLLLLAFDKGPLSSDAFISLPRFVAVACFPIKCSSAENGKTPHPHSSKSFGFDTNPSSIKPNSVTKQNLSGVPSKKDGGTPLLGYALKGIAVGILVKIYDYSESINPNVLMCMYCFHIYFMLEIILAVVAAAAKTLLGMELEPQFKNPLLSTSLQDFWGRRWNLMVTSILRPTVYEPTMKAALKIVGPTWAPLPAVMSTFVVSGLMHELILFYMGRSEPTFRMTGFFLLHGLGLMVEIALKRALTGRWRLPRFLSGLLTLVFFMATCFSLFLPEFIRCRIQVRAVEEYVALGHLLTPLSSSFSAIFHNKS
ncbi:Acyl-CoA--sterol O-acyltransferase [Vigna angularis]|uniref:Acyl-CoA--sterol O-acyltransferase n=1 Tax=Phaseolus angularis TaxID=3914 RepID=A0A8T0KEA1_PHAAN|nr:acyl-CoA--sterol O-acyltransferase 1 [Vigna angularis]KAG2398200.1 Acyl-CoA--sterol O-acyltransferase [Vigna angularis]